MLSVFKDITFHLLKKVRFLNLKHTLIELIDNYKIHLYNTELVNLPFNQLIFLPFTIKSMIFKLS